MITASAGQTPHAGFVSRSRICVKHLHNFMKRHRLGFIARVAESSRESSARRLLKMPSGPAGEYGPFSSNIPPGMTTTVLSRSRVANPVYSGPQSEELGLHVKTSKGENEKSKNNSMSDKRVWCPHAGNYATVPRYVCTSGLA